VPDEYFVDFLRSCIDGDGSITTYTDRYNTFKNPQYVYARLYVSLVSASFRLSTGCGQPFSGLSASLVT
jgi:hypothetical protein